MLNVNNLNSGFIINDKKISVVRDLSFSLSKGETLGIAGESGCGKTITAYSIMRLLNFPAKIFSGQILFNGCNLLNLQEKDMQKIRGKDIAMIFQEPSAALDPCYSAGEHICEALKSHTSLNKAERKENAISLIKDMMIPDAQSVFNKYPHELSGGMQQRIMIAIALSCNPSLLIADEPTTALDVTVQSQILAIIKEKVEKSNLGLIFISHDLGITANLCQKTAIMYAGEIVELGTSEKIFSEPQHPYTKALLEALPKLNKKCDKLKTISGSVAQFTENNCGCMFYERCTKRTTECKKNNIGLKDTGNKHFCRCINR